MARLNLDYLQTFVDVAALGSFTAAAQRHRLSQPAISLQMRQLEKQVGVRLLERVGRRAQPTAAGQELLAHAQQINAAVAAAFDGLARHAKGVMGRVRIGTGATVCIYLLPPLLRKLRKRFPTLDITISTGNTAEVVKAVEDNLLDIGLVTLPASGRMLEITPLIDDDLVAVAPSQMALPARLTAAALAELPLLLFEPGGNTRRLTDAWFARSRVTPAPVMSLGSVEAIKKLVGAGLGCAVLPQMAVRSPRDREGLQVQPLSPPLQRQLATVVRRDKPLHRGLRETLDVLMALRQSAPAA
ncbi:LysR family transcriptional regulator [Aquabacterium sp.]|uniref:LysR family transcriptional regulator n=1 Tax=Aquabacterium sp. TaxID=1872578 RepID=UPI002BFCDBE1|nr:LysR family transcriptional regulator [Aquabacterium sp.]HSW08939.1 LysR family transcriptional regulator [Aquabacterium sp.]